MLRTVELTNVVNYPSSKSHVSILCQGLQISHPSSYTDKSIVDITNLHQRHGHDVLLLPTLSVEGSRHV